MQPPDTAAMLIEEFMRRITDAARAGELDSPAAMVVAEHIAARVIRACAATPSDRGGVMAEFCDRLPATIEAYDLLTATGQQKT